MVKLLYQYDNVAGITDWISSERSLVNTEEPQPL